MRIIEILLDIHPIGVISSGRGLFIHVPLKISKNKVLPYVGKRFSKENP